jgi:inner membrane protein YidH
VSGRPIRAGPHSPVPGADDDRAVDATRRTRLANERTYLAWWRSGLTAFAVALAAGKLVPELSDADTWPYELLGLGFAVLGTAFVLYGHRRQTQVERALAEGSYAPPEPLAVALFTGAGVVLGVGLLAVLLLAEG